MAINISGRQMYVQFIDDEAGGTLASASTVKMEGTPNIELAKKLGTLAADAAKAKGIGCVVVDRGGFSFRGRVKQIVESAVEGGLTIEKETK